MSIKRYGQTGRIKATQFQSQSLKLRLITKDREQRAQVTYNESEYEKDRKPFQGLAIRLK